MSWMVFRPEPSCLSRKLEFLSFENLGDVQVKEIAVEDRLNAAGNDGDDVVESWNVKGSLLARSGK